jgi:uroporphyrinogen-III synthase
VCSGDPFGEPRSSALVFFSSTDAAERLARYWAAITLIALPTRTCLDRYAVIGGALDSELRKLGGKAA